MAALRQYRGVKIMTARNARRVAKKGKTSDSKRKVKDAKEIVIKHVIARDDEDGDCPDCDGTGIDENGDECETCHGTGNLSMEDDDGDEDMEDCGDYVSATSDADYYDTEFTAKQRKEEAKSGAAM